MHHSDINVFMAEFHAFEREHALFFDRVGAELWWDSVRYDVCAMMFELVAGAPYASIGIERPRPRRLGVLRRQLQRQLLHARALTRRGGLLAFRAPRSTSDGRTRDVIIDPLLDLFPGQVLGVDTIPRRFHLPDHDPARWAGTVPTHVTDLTQALVGRFDVAAQHAARLDGVVRRVRSAFAGQVDGYRRLFDRAAPAAVALVQNGIEKAMFHVATERAVPSFELQHGAIGFGHPQYSYPAGIDYSAQTTLPTMLLTFAPVWQNNLVYPVKRYAVVGTDFYGEDIAPVSQSLGGVMVCSADIYHDLLLPLTRQAASALPDRRFVYKLHPNQHHRTSAIRAELQAWPNIDIGDATVPAARLMDDVSHVVGVQSTVIYEALQQCRRPCIVRGLDYSIHADIFPLPQTRVVETADELIGALSIPDTGSEHPVFFQRFQPETVRDLLAPLLGTDREVPRP